MRTSSRCEVFHWNWYALMKFQPARHTSTPNSNTAGSMSGEADVPTVAAGPSAPLSMSFDVNTSGDAGGATVFAGATNALPIVEKLIGSQKT